MYPSIFEDLRMQPQADTQVSGKGHHQEGGGGGRGLGQGNCALHAGGFQNTVLYEAEQFQSFVQTRDGICLLTYNGTTDFNKIKLL